MANEIQEIRKLEDWITFDESREMLGLTKQGIHYLVWEAQEFDLDDIRAIGSGRVVIYLLRQTAVERKVAERLAQAQAKVERLRASSKK